MKKLLSVLTALSLIFVLCLNCFATAVELTDSDPVLDSVSSIVAKIGSVDEDEKEFTQDDAIKDIIGEIKGLGVENTKEALDAVDQLYNFGAIDMDMYKALQEAVKNDTELDKDAAKRDIISQIEDVMNDDSLDVAGKAAAIGKLLVGLPVEQVQDILDTLLDNGTIDNDMYNRISDAINNASIENITNIFSGGGNSALGGITDLISNLLGMLGLGGGDSGNGESGNSGNSNSSRNNSSSNSSSSSNSTSNQVPNTKTGDYALISVAGVAAVAGVAFILTRKKNDKE